MTLEELIEDQWKYDPEFGRYVPLLRAELATLRAKAAAFNAIRAAYENFDPTPSDTLTESLRIHREFTTEVARVLDAIVTSGDVEK